MQTDILPGASFRTTAHGQVRKEQPRSIPDDFSALVRERPDALAVVDDRGNSLSRTELDFLAHEIAQEMSEHGLAAGDVVIICMPNWVEWLAIYLAALSLELIPGTLPVTSEPGSIAYVTELVGACAVFLPSSHRGRSFIDEVEELAAERSSRLLSMFVDAGSRDREWITIDGGDVQPPAYPELLEHILFSSSTTGKSKAIAHSEASLRAYNEGVIERYHVDSSKAIFMPSPLGHSTGFWHGARMSIIVGAPLVLQDRWDPETALHMISEYRCGITVAATPFLIDLVEAAWDSDEPKLQSMHTFLCGGAPIPPALMRRAQQQLPHTRICSIWAMSEGGATSSLPEDPIDLIATTCGTALPGTELETMNEGEINPRGVEGELIMKTPSLFLGYIDQQELYEQSFTADGYFRTGDLGVIDARGYLSITGRLKDLIIRGGVNLSPVEIEHALAGFPGIARLAVVGEPDDRMGERICAVIQATGEPPTLEALIEWLNAQRFPRRLWPESIRTVDSMPETPAGKIRKNVLVETLFPAR